MHELRESGGHLLGDQVPASKPAAAQLVPIPGYHAHSSCSNSHFSGWHHAISSIDVRFYGQAQDGHSKE